MYLKLEFLFIVLFIGGLQARYELDDKDKRCFISSKSDLAPIYQIGVGHVLDIEENENFLLCRYAQYFDDDNNIIINDESKAVLSHYITSILNGNAKLGSLIAVEILHSCKELNEKNRGKALVKASNCILKHIKELDATC